MTTATLYIYTGPTGHPGHVYNGSHSFPIPDQNLTYFPKNKNYFRSYKYRQADNSYFVEMTWQCSAHADKSN